MRGARGFVLVNAIVLVAALSAAALVLLSRAEAARVRTGAANEAAQLTASLDAFEALAVTVLNADQISSTPGDHLGEDWAADDITAPLGRGAVSGRLRDLQGLYNLNWLAYTNDTSARAAFDRLADTLGLPSTKVEAIVAHLSPGGPASPTGYGRMAVPSRPLGGPLSMARQLAEIPALSPRDVARLQALTTALPNSQAINVNTAPAAVLAAFLPTANAASLGALVAEAQRAPFTSVDAFIDALGGIIDDEARAAVAADRFTVSSGWFGLTVTATLEGRSATRSATLRRWPSPRSTEVEYRVDDWNG